MDYKKYQKIQQTIIDTLDTCEWVEIKGKGENETDLLIHLHTLTDAKTQTNFENCVADVNIPLGEVFTSPVLAGTGGMLHVSKVYLNGLQFCDLKLVFDCGQVIDYSCSNFETEEENRKYIEDNILFHHPKLAMGEFAIGTNTTAYVAAQKYNIADKLPILIAEKWDRILQLVIPVTAGQKILRSIIRMVKRLSQGTMRFPRCEKKTSALLIMDVTQILRSHMTNWEASVRLMMRGI